MLVCRGDFSCLSLLSVRNKTVHNKGHLVSRFPPLNSISLAAPLKSPYSYALVLSLRLHEIRSTQRASLAKSYQMTKFRLYTLLLCTSWLTGYVTYLSKQLSLCWNEIKWKRARFFSQISLKLKAGHTEVTLFLLTLSTMLILIQHCVSETGSAFACT